MSEQRLLDYVGNSAAGGDDEQTKLATAYVNQQEYAQRKLAGSYDEGLFRGRGFAQGMMKKIAAAISGNEKTGVDNVNPPSAAQSPLKGGIELPTDGPGPNDTLKTTRPGGGEQHNNHLFQNKIDEKKLKAGLADVQNDGVALLSGSAHGTSAQVSIDHNQGGNMG